MLVKPSSIWITDYLQRLVAKRITYWKNRRNSRKDLEKGQESPELKLIERCMMVPDRFSSYHSELKTCRTKYQKLTSGASVGTGIGGTVIVVLEKVVDVAVDMELDIIVVVAVLVAVAVNVWFGFRPSLSNFKRCCEPANSPTKVWHHTC